MTRYGFDYWKGKIGLSDDALLNWKAFDLEEPCCFLPQEGDGCERA
jgi:hypothetical protein